MDDRITRKILETIEKAGTVLETKEIVEAIQASVGKTTRTIVFSRLSILRGDGLIKGKFVGPGKGVWIWWKQELLTKGGKHG